MFFLTDNEKKEWRSLADEALAGKAGPGQFSGNIRPNLAPMLDYYLGTFLAAKGEVALGRQWLAAGALAEEEKLMSNAYLSSFLERQRGKLIMPAVVFADPKPYIHFTGVPVMREARVNFLRQCSGSLPKFSRPVRIMDIGCGDGSLTAQFIDALRAAGKAGDIRAFDAAGTLIVTSVKNEIADRMIEAGVEEMLSYQVISMQNRGLVPNKESSIAKLFSSELDVRIAGTAMHVLGPYGQLRTGSPHAPAGGRVESTYLYATTSTVGGGTSEIQRNIIAQSLLGRAPRA